VPLINTDQPVANSHLVWRIKRLESKFSSVPGKVAWEMVAVEM
jgi:hypothetical protein